ncbi:MAG TPA: tetratricopeptide repeat protein [Gammaproteobacteria bacterium]
MNFVRFFLLFGLLLSTAAFGARDGGGYGGGLAPVSNPRTPEEMAIGEYNAGVKQRDKAWEYEQRAKPLEDGKKKEKFLKKAQKAYKKAIGRFEKAVEYDPRMYQAWSALGHGLRKTGSYDRALEAYNNALDINPDYHEAIEYRAEAYLHLHDYEAVKAAYARLKKEHPEYAGQLMQAVQEWLPAQHADNNLELRAFARWAARQQ